MQVNIRAVVDDLKNIDIKNVIFEALANAIQAKATEINVKIYTNSLIKDNQTPFLVNCNSLCAFIYADEFTL